MTVGFTYKLEHFQSMPGASNPIINRYFYQHVAGSGLGAIDLATSFMTTVVPDIQNIQANALVHTSIKVTTVDDESDFVELPFATGETGTIAIEALPPFVTAAFILHRPFLSFRSGRKAYAGVPETGQAGGFVNPSYQTVLDIVAERLAEVLTEASTGNDFAPVLVRNYTSAPPTRVVAQIVNASFKRIGSQNSRK